MARNSKYSDEELKEYINKFYDYFSDGYKFEEFLKIYLEKLGFTEVVVTKRSRDGGIDLTASRTTIGVFGNEHYFIQAKRNKPSTTVSPEKIRSLRGSINSYGKGVFITTAKVSDNAKEDALHFDPSKPIIVIDGKELVANCIDLEIGFVFRPQFSKLAMDLLMNVSPQSDSKADDDCVEKLITANDIRARIISIPKYIMDQIPAELEEINVSINNNPSIPLSINRNRNYLARVTTLFKRYNLVDEENTPLPRKAKWKIDENNTIYIKLV